MGSKGREVEGKKHFHPGAVVQGERGWVGPHLVGKRFRCKKPSEGQKIRTMTTTSLIKEEKGSWGKKDARLDKRR